MAHVLDIDDVILNFDPAAPHARFRTMGLPAEALTAAAALPQPVPWPEGGAPKAAPLAQAPAESDDLSRFRGYDAVVMTWTAAEASAMATLFTPGYPTSDWYEYRYDISNFIPLVTGKDAPFNDTSKEMARYYHSLGLYFPCTIGNARVLLVKSGLHLDYDGPQTPLKQMVAGVAQAVAPKLFITTGTGGGIGADVMLGDVVVAGTVRFDCKRQFANEPWASASYRASALPAAALDAITPALTAPNAARIPNARKTPKIFSGSAGTVVTTDFFAFDDSTDYYKLQGPCRACATIASPISQALQGYAEIAWYSIRNASDPQIPNPNHNIEQASKEAAQIYARYGGLTTAASLIATWAVIHAATGATAARPGYKLGRLPRH